MDKKLKVGKEGNIYAENKVCRFSCIKWENSCNQTTLLLIPLQQVFLYNQQNKRNKNVKVPSLTWLNPW